MERILENEAMAVKEESVAYQKVVKIYTRWLQLPFVNLALKKIPNTGGKILDVGSGTGEIVITLAKKNPALKIYALDLSPTMMAIAKENAEREGVADRIIFVDGDAKRLPFPDAYFDLVISHNFLHHIEDPQIVFAEMKRVVKKNSDILIRDLRRPSKFILKLFVAIFGLPYDRLMKKLYQDSMYASFTIKEVKKLLNESNLKGAQVLPYLITHYTISYRPRDVQRQSA